MITSFKYKFLQNVHTVKFSVTVIPQLGNMMCHTFHILNFSVGLRRPLGDSLWARFGPGAGDCAPLSYWLASCSICDDVQLQKVTSCAGGRHDMPPPPCKLTISSYLFARWHLFWHVGYKTPATSWPLSYWLASCNIWPFDLETGARVTCDVGYLCANFSLPRPLSVLELGQMYATYVRQTDVRQKHRLMPPPYGGGRRHNNERESNSTTDTSQET